MRLYQPESQKEMCSSQVGEGGAHIVRGVSGALSRRMMSETAEAAPHTARILSQ